MGKLWYVLHTLTGQEEKVKANLLGRLERSKIQDKIAQVIIPTEVVSEVKSRQEDDIREKVFSGVCTC